MEEGTVVQRVIYLLNDATKSGTIHAYTANGGGTRLDLSQEQVDDKCLSLSLSAGNKCRR